MRTCSRVECSGEHYALEDNPAVLRQAAYYIEVHG